MTAPATRSSPPSPRRSAHWLHTVTRPLASTMSRRSAIGVACSRWRETRPGTANQAASPVIHRLTSAPAAAADAATVNAWFARSGSSAPAVHFTTRDLTPPDTRLADRGFRDPRQPAPRLRPGGLDARDVARQRPRRLPDDRRLPVRAGADLHPRRPPLLPLLLAVLAGRREWRARPQRRPRDRLPALQAGREPG